MLYTVLRKVHFQGKIIIIDVVIYTDIYRDGSLRGVNIDETLNLAKAISLPVIASGGVSSIDEIIKLHKLKQDGIVGVVIGKALYEKKITIEEVNKLIKN